MNLLGLILLSLSIYKTKEASCLFPHTPNIQWGKIQDNRYRHFCSKRVTVKDSLACSDFKVESKNVRYSFIRFQSLGIILHGFFSYLCVLQLPSHLSSSMKGSLIWWRSTSISLLPACGISEV